MDYGVRLETSKGALDELRVGEVADERLDSMPGHLFPCADAVLEVLDGNETVDTHLEVVLTAHEVVDHSDVVATPR